MKGKLRSDRATRNNVVARVKAAYERPQQDRDMTPTCLKEKGTSLASTAASKQKVGGFLWGGGREKNQGSLQRESIKEDEPSEIIIEEVLEEDFDEEVIEEVIDEVFEEPHSQSGSMPSHRGRNHLMFDQLLIKLMEKK
ncbi:unnamed protein product [Cylindrotheca closterium]|uniref:Uncharacterized protein n=1 Tax=Cylindrotheca closterium TaxID=2856 RepID=A0AAD2JGI4_9STRA|nr:unnamed protein product [Cylindrotheca closterium]